MTTERITIDKHEDKTSQGGKDYSRFSTNLGWLSCFEEELIKELKLLGDGNSIEVEVAISEKNGQTFKNIRNVYSRSKTDQPTMNTTSNEIKVPVAVKTNNTTATMYASYSKDIFLGIHEALTRVEVNGDLDEKAIMAKAIELVKQAQEAFS